MRKSRIQGRRRRDVHESRYTNGSSRYPAIVAFLDDFAAKNDAKLGRAKLGRLAPSARVHPHSDRGAYYRGRDRYHLVLHSTGNSPLIADGESVRMRERELWWFDNKSVHEARNDSQDDRIHLIFDVRPRNALRLRSRCSSIHPIAGDLGVALTEADACAAALGSGASKSALHAEGELIAGCVRLYLSGCAAPQRWASLLDLRGADETADEQPLHALAHAVLHIHEPKRVRRLARALGWALAEIDEGTLAIPEIARVVVERGGMKTIARTWRALQRRSAEPTG